MHHAALASVLASSSMTGTYCAGSSWAPPSECGSSMRNRPRSTSAATIASGSWRLLSMSSAAAASAGAISRTRER